MTLKPLFIVSIGIFNLIFSILAPYIKIFEISNIQ